MRALASCAAALVALSACGGEDAQLIAHVAPDVAREAPSPMAVFGVYRDGRMSTRTWDEQSPRLGVLGLLPCTAVYDADFVTNAGELAMAVDDYTRSFGVSDSLLSAFGAAAQADLILVFVVSGAVPTRSAAPEEPRPVVMRTPRGAPPRGAMPHHDRGALEITASVFSTRRHAQVAAVSLRYTGRSENDAFAAVDAKLKELFPAASCAAWDLEKHPLDPTAVRGLPED
jgi:hypothetical protein